MQAKRRAQFTHEVSKARFLTIAKLHLTTMWACGAAVSSHHLVRQLRHQGRSIHEALSSCCLYETVLYTSFCTPSRSATCGC